MKKTILFIVCLLNLNVFSQEDAWVYFNAKPNAQNFYDNPLQMLTQRALDRRTTQQINLDSKDVPLHQPYINQISSATGITILGKSKWLNALHIRGTQANIALLINLPFVEKVVYANHSLNPSGRTTIVAGKSFQGNKFQNTETTYNYGNSAAQIQMLNGHILHQQNHTGAGKIVAIMDAGFPGVNTASPFQHLRDNNLILGGYNFINNTPNPYSGNSHGTNVLSNMGGKVDGQLVGTAPDAKYYLFITEDVASETPLEETNWVEAAEMADSLGVDVINTSLGYFTYDNPNYSYNNSHLTGRKAFISKGADVAFSRGMICVTSAGNSGNSGSPYISVPADVPSTLTVGAVDASEVKASFSSIGLTTSINPLNILKPDVMAMGVASVVATPSGSIGTSNGTSFSSPILAGALTSFWSAFPNKKNSEIIQFIKASSDRFSNPNNQYGYGIPDFQAALLSALSTEKFANNNTFKLFPNPVNKNLTITIPDNMLGSEIILYNNLGQSTFKAKINNIIETISLESLNAGVYFYSITSNGSNLRGKIIKN